MPNRPATYRNRSGRKRRWAGWVLLVIGVLIAGVWGASARCGLTYGCESGTVSIAGGVLGYVEFEWSHLDGGWRTVSANEWQWFLSPPSHFMREAGSWVFVTPVLGYAVNGSGGYGIMAKAVLWPFALASLLGGGWLVWSGRQARRRAVAGVCLKCGYDLVGLAAGAPCPECGNARVS